MAMSGGIDSTVAALLLQEQGYELVGVTYRTFDQVSQECLSKEKGCCTIDSIMEAKNMAKKLGFEHHILDIRKEFYDSVICDFIQEYLKGRTPNPCVLCNSTIKWGKLQEIADLHNCHYIATGHYAQIGEENGRHYLIQGKDTNKDQTYFLWKLSQENLARTLFPLGHLTKPEVREIARNHGYVKLSQKTESQEICFIADDNYRNFLAQEVDNFDTKYGPGNYMDKDGKVLGKHKGFPNYTIGQRKGLGIALGEPMYVTSINAKKNEVVLGRREELQSQTCLINDINLMRQADFEDGQTVLAKIRYKSRPAEATLWHEPDGIRVHFTQAIESITPGQSLVAYNGTEVVLGGIIK